MLTRREILNELRRIGIKEPSRLETYLKDFELYVQVNHGSDFGKMKGAIAGDKGFKFSFSDGTNRQKKRERGDLDI